MKNKYVFTAVLLLMLTAVGAGIIHVSSVRHLEAQGNDTLHIVTSFYPMYIAAENIAGDIEGIEVSNLTEPQTGCLHDYQMTPQDMILLSEADVFIINGGGIESFLDDVTEGYPDLKIITASEGITYLGEEDSHESEAEHEEHSHEADVHEEHDHEEHSHKDHDHGDVNAHVWMDVHRYIQEIENIRNELMQADPAHADLYQANALEYLEKLRLLEQELDGLKHSAENKKIVIFHDAFAYFADSLGWEIAGVISMDGETSFSANQISDIVSLVCQERIDLLFTEEQYGTKLADAVARETPAEVYVLDSLVSGSYDADSYINGMKKNLEILKEALGKEE